VAWHPVGITRDTAARSRLAESCVEEPSDRERETCRPILLAAQVATIQGGAAPREVCSRSAPIFGLHRERFAAGLHQISACTARGLQPACTKFFLGTPRTTPSLAGAPFGIARPNAIITWRLGNASRRIILSLPRQGQQVLRASY